jgi:hypothetical protein
MCEVADTYGFVLELCMPKRLVEAAYAYALLELCMCQLLELCMCQLLELCMCQLLELCIWYFAACVEAVTCADIHPKDRGHQTLLNPKL